MRRIAGLSLACALALANEPAGNHGSSRCRQACTHRWRGSTGPAPPRRWRSGREFSYALQAAVARKSDAHFALALDRLIQSGLLFRQSVPPQATYLFKHPLVPDAEGYRVAMHTRCFQCAGLSR